MPTVLSDAAEQVPAVQDNQEASNTSESSKLFQSHSIKARTARQLLKKLWLEWGTLHKGVYVDDHERENVREYRQKVFIQQWYGFHPPLICFDESGAWWIPDTLPQREKPLLLVTHHESSFNANDEMRQLWMFNGKHLSQPKSKGKGIMVSAFLTPNGVLQVPSAVPDTELPKDPI